MPDTVYLTISKGSTTRSVSYPDSASARAAYKRWTRDGWKVRSVSRTKPEGKHAYRRSQYEKAHR